MINKDSDPKLVNILDLILACDSNRLSYLCEIAELDKTEDYIGCDLHGDNLSNDDLSGFNFTNANLSNADFTNSILTDAIFTNANLEGAIFTNCKSEGLYGKFIIRKADGTPIDPKAKYIVLRYDADSNDGNFARGAILKYAALIKSFNPQFADDLLKEMEIEQIKYREPLYESLANK